MKHICSIVLLGMLCSFSSMANAVTYGRLYQSSSKHRIIEQREAHDPHLAGDYPMLITPVRHKTVSSQPTPSTGATFDPIASTGILGGLSVLTSQQRMHSTVLSTGHYEQSQRNAGNQSDIAQASGAMLLDLDLGGEVGVGELEPIDDAVPALLGLAFCYLVCILIQRIGAHRYFFHDPKHGRRQSSDDTTAEQ